MKLPMLVIGLILFFIGAFTKMKFLIAVGMILMLMSFFGGVIKRKKAKKQEKLLPKKRKTKLKDKCSRCGAETLQGDIYCPECGKKLLP